MKFIPLLSLYLFSAIQLMHVIVASTWSHHIVALIIAVPKLCVESYKLYFPVSVYFWISLASF